MWAKPKRLLRLGFALALTVCIGSAAARETAPAADTAALPVIAAARLPAEAVETLARIRRGGPFPYPKKDGSTFGNYEGRLPPRTRGYYREYTVPTPGARTRGARRIVAGSPPATSGEYYYTDDHYRSFRRIRE